MSGADNNRLTSLSNRLVKWKETYELSFELADVTYTLLDVLIKYCKENDIPLYKEKGIWNLTKKARHLFKLIEEVNSPNFNPQKIIRRKFTTNKSDEDLTEPPVIRFIY